RLATVGVQEVEVVLLRFETGAEIRLLRCGELCLGGVGKGAIVMGDCKCFGSRSDIQDGWDVVVSRRSQCHLEAEHSAKTEGGCSRQQRATFEETTTRQVL